jgi:exodeoxyribonuclease VII small subunit
MKNFREEIANMSFEQAMSELEKIVIKLETGKETLENAINDYEYGNALREFCEKKLSDAKLKIDQIVKKDDGTISTVPSDIE